MKLFARSQMAPPGDINFWGDAPNTETARYVQDLGTENDAAIYAEAYEKWKAKAMDSASIGNAVAEGGQALNMIANRAGQVIQSFKALKRGRFGDLLAELGVERIQKRRSTRAKQASNLWLEWHFGIDPLLGDIYDACKVLEGPSRTQTSHASSAYRNQIRYPTGSWDGYVSVSYQRSIRVQGTIRIDNPNLHLASQMGLINPLSIAWELVPFSFIIDWFLPVGNFLSNLTTLAGAHVESGMVMRKLSAFGHERIGAPPDEPGGPIIGRDQSNSAYKFTREVGTPILPSLAFKVLKGQSVSRAATAVSLLLTVIDSSLSSTKVGRRG
jgi:hypothetical protein